MKKNSILVCALSILNCGCNERQKLTKEDKKIVYSFSDTNIYESQDTVGIALCLGEDITKILLQERNESWYLMSIKNIGFDTLFVGIRSPSGIPIFESSDIEYFRNILDTVNIDRRVPFTSGDELLKIVKGSERYFITDLRLREGVAKIKYQFFTDSYKKNEITEYVYLTRKEGRFIQLKK